MSSASESMHTDAVAGVVRLLCDARLATLAVAALTASVDAAGGAVVFILLALPFSFVPLRSWDRKGSMYSRSRILLGCDIVMTVVVMALLVVIFHVPEIGAVYACATTALFGVVLGRRWALPVSALLAAWHVLLLMVGDQPLGWKSITAGATGGAAVLGLGWGGDRLGRILVDQAATADELARTRSLEAATQERAHLAREMHDSLAKTVHGIGLLGAALAEQLRRDASPYESTARLIEVACRDANRDTRSLISGLRALTQGSLRDAVEASTRRWADATGTPVSLEVPVDAAPTGVDAVDAEVAWAVIRLLDASLDNVRRHARASTVQVGLVLSDGIRLRVTDDGCGFDLPADGLVDAPGLQAAGHFGLVGMVERVESLGGRIRFVSTPGVGTQVLVDLPRHVDRCDGGESLADVLAEQANA